MSLSHNAVTVDQLTHVMEFDCPIRVHDDGTVSDAHDVNAPDLLDDELSSDEWELLDGYSGQYRYSGPIMHPSEFIGGGLARDILAQPGVYVSLVSYYATEEDDEIVTDADGWAVARLIEKGE